MIVACPSCVKRYRVDESRVGEGRRLRCTGCGTVFRGTSPREAPSGPAARPVPAEPAGPARRPDGAAPTPPPGPPAGEAGPERPLVLVADEDPEFRALAGRTLSALGCEVEMTSDGRSAFQFAVSRRPALLLLNAGLKKLSGSAVCGGVKGSPHLSGIKVVLVGRRPQNDCGADDVIDTSLNERDLCSRLAAIVGRGGDDPRHEIGRLARIMVSDLKLYNPDRFERALQDGQFLRAFRMELTRGRDMIVQRFPDLPGCVALLSSALREALESERRSSAAPGEHRVKGA